MTTRYTRAAASPGYDGVWDGEEEMSDRDVLARLNAQEGEIGGLRLSLATAHEAIGAARALLHELDGSGLYPHSSVTIGVVLMALERATR